MGSNRIPNLGTVHPIKDETDLLIIDAAERKQIPLFAICFGMQVLNVSRGGTLIQDIRSQLPEAIKHEQGAPRDRPSHPCKSSEGTQAFRDPRRTQEFVDQQSSSSGCRNAWREPRRDCVESQTE